MHPHNSQTAGNKPYLGPTYWAPIYRIPIYRTPIYRTLTYWGIGVVWLLAISCTQASGAPSSALQLAKQVEPLNHQVVIAGFKFNPSVLEVNPGDTVTWVNKDVAPHNVVDGASNTKLSPILATNNEYTLTIKEDLNYICSLHPIMKGRITLLRAE